MKRVALVYAAIATPLVRGRPVTGSEVRSPRLTSEDCVIRMRRAAWTALLVLHAPWVPAADPLCCRLFGFDASSMLGPEAAQCGRILDADDRNKAQSETLEERQRATRCALEAQARGRAFVYTYRLLASPDVDMVFQAVFGARGERLLLRMGLYAGENIRSVENCAALTVQADGKVRKEGCYLRQGILD